MSIIGSTDSIFLSKMIGKLLGDGSITMQSGRKPRFQFIHRVEDKEWSVHCYKLLKGHVPLNSPKYRKIYDKRIRKGYSESYYVLSKTSPIITELESIWYINRKKIVPIDFVQKYFNRLSLAWWYQDDGSFNVDKKNNIPRKIILSTDSFAKEENVFLTRILKKKYNLNFSLDGQNRLIIYNAAEIHYFLSLVQPYLHPSMSRKMLSSYPIYFKNITSKRTAIYLPEYINLSKPTETVNEKLESLNFVLEIYKKGIYFESELHHISKQLKSNKTSTRPYIIRLKQESILQLKLLKSYTGLSYSELATLCFLINPD